MAKNKGRWIKERKSISKYPNTEHQKRIAEAGKRVALECKGKKGSEFRFCRIKVMERFFGK